MNPEPIYNHSRPVLISRLGEPTSLISYGEVLKRAYSKTNGDNIGPLAYGVVNPILELDENSNPINASGDALFLPKCRLMGEDRIDPLGPFAVVDVQGDGVEASKVANTLVTAITDYNNEQTAFGNLFDRRTLMSGAIKSAHDALRGLKDPAAKSSGAFVQFNKCSDENNHFDELEPQELSLIHFGDARVYKYSLDGYLSLLTTDGRVVTWQEDKIELSPNESFAWTMCMSSYTGDDNNEISKRAEENAINLLRGKGYERNVAKEIFMCNFQNRDHVKGLLGEKNLRINTQHTPYNPGDLIILTTAGITDSLTLQKMYSAITYYIRGMVKHTRSKGRQVTTLTDVPRGLQGLARGITDSAVLAESTDSGRRDRDRGLLIIDTTKIHY